MLPRFQLIALFLLSLLISCKPATDDNTTWRVYGGSKQSTRYSALTQIDTSNVTQLKMVWIHHTNDADTAAHSQMQCNPIIVNSTLYATTPRLRLIALDAKTGVQKWGFDPAENSLNKSKANFNMNNNRGVTYWEDGDDKRILYCAGSYLYAVNAETGKIIPDFGENGKVDLHNGLGVDAKKMYVTATSPGIIYKDLYILGSRVNETADAAPGHIRAYDVHTGKIRWVFHTIPRPGEFGYDTWEDKNAWKHIGSANCWTGFSLDDPRGLLYVPTGSAAYDFYGGKRKGAGLFANCLLALDAATGKLKWHYQVIHHDMWDKDLPAAPSLVTIHKDGKAIDAVAQPTKHGFIFVLDRVTGKPIFPIDETPVSTVSELKGEKPWPTQPIPRLPQPFARQTLTEKDINPYLSDSSKKEVLNRLKTYRYGSMFLPPGHTPSVIFPGFDGGAEWGGPAYDPATGIFYINANEMPWILTMIDANFETGKNENYGQAGERLFANNCMGCHGKDRKGTGNYPSLINIGGKYNSDQIAALINTGRRMMPSFKQLSGSEKNAIISFITDNKNAEKKAFKHENVKQDTFLNLPYQMTGYNRFLSKEGYPAIAPPWGTLTAINLNTGKIVWKVPLGEDAALMKKGYPITGSENYGGPVVTAGGLVFIAATKDGKMRAFNKLTGKLLWQAQLPAAGFATPSVYEEGGKQYLVVACGGGKLGTKTGDAYVAFALP
jgi:quinoprotein glucose dehydrogenase